jgi:hypothetical protein
MQRFEIGLVIYMSDFQTKDTSLNTTVIFFKQYWLDPESIWTKQLAFELNK